MAFASRASDALGADMADGRPSLPIVPDSLALALVASSDAPILLLDGALSVIAASASFVNAFQIDPAIIETKSLFALGSGEWDVPQLRSLLRATLSGAAEAKAFEMDLKPAGREPRRLVITAHQLDYGDPENVRLLLAVSDVTDARLAERLKDDLLREKAVLFQELQHRVANSLQIIASVLMQTARRTPSAETKGHLYDAHNRVMSVAALQRQLVASSLENIQLRTYFNELCDSIGASMIPDPSKLTLDVRCDEASATPDVSVSLGLIVTELVINALKHAFPAGRGGHILVRYQVHGPDWTLSVSDDGAGMPKGTLPAKAGLGTSIVQALARQLDADVTVADAMPGTNVSVMHKTGARFGHTAVPALAV
jgi:two-component sensor histidine kinase